MKPLLVWAIFLSIMIVPFISFMIFVAYFRTINNEDVDLIDCILGTVIFYLSVSFGLQFQKYINGKSTKKT